MILRMTICSNVHPHTATESQLGFNVNSHGANVVYSCNDSVLISRSLARIVIFYQLTIVIYRRILFWLGSIDTLAFCTVDCPPT
jgi:hypothetical protein